MFSVVPGDEKRLTQVLNNLLSNAIKSSPDGGDIVISGSALPEYMSLFQFMIVALAFRN